jgi:hypothetical protein
MRVISWLAEKLLASQEGLCSSTHSSRDVIQGVQFRFTGFLICCAVNEADGRVVSGKDVSLIQKILITTSAEVFVRDYLFIDESLRP